MEWTKLFATATGLIYSKTELKRDMIKEPLERAFD
jgi:hypothetical protein